VKRTLTEFAVAVLLVASVVAVFKIAPTKHALAHQTTVIYVDANGNLRYKP
jgi:hypothetical protein